MDEQIPPGAFLIVNSQILPLNKEVLYLGRGPDNDLVINDPSVSRRHARMFVRKGRYYIADLNSTGGTYLNGDKIRQRRVQSGDIIALAGVSMLYVENQLKLISALWEETRPPEGP